ncbi:MAG: TlpA disulfide reductase family protein [Legionella sp.]|nr:TlpA disulfide reductase family protein [Legionella sp.]
MKIPVEVYVIRLKLLVGAWFIFALIPFATADVLLTDISGKKISFSSLKGKWVLINYWASWCEPCLDEIAQLNKFHQTQKEKVALFAVNFDYLPVQEQVDLIKKLHIHYPSLSEDPGSLLGLEQVRGVPATFVFDPDGNLSTTLYGSQTLSSLNEATKQNNRIM